MIHFVSIDQNVCQDLAHFISIGQTLHKLVNQRSLGVRTDTLTNKLNSTKSEIKIKNLLTNNFELTGRIDL